MATCGKCLHKEVCVDYRYYKPNAQKCPHFKEMNVAKNLQTNADRIRAMTDEELGIFLAEWAEKPWTWKKDGEGECLVWLKQPVEEVINNAE